MSKKKKKGNIPEGAQLVAANRKARFNYEVVDSVEAGMMLMGSEVKSLRDGKLTLGDAYVLIEKNEAWMHHAHIGEYAQAGYAGHLPLRTRKLLMHRREIDRLATKVKEKGITLIPLEVYFKNGRAKVNLGLCRGKAQHDKRHSIRDRDQKRAARRDFADV